MHTMTNAELAAAIDYVVKTHAGTGRDDVRKILMTHLQDLLAVQLARAEMVALDDVEPSPPADAPLFRVFTTRPPVPASRA